MDKLDLEVVITSYNRWHLLKPCVESLLNMIGNDYKVTLIEDSAKPHMKENIEREFGNKVNFIFNEQNLGQLKSIDKAYYQVKSKYILKVEDDYVFHGNKNFMQEAIDVLENVPHVHHVWLRHLSNYMVSHGPAYDANLFEPSVLSTPNGTKYKMLTANHYGDWSGFTFMPHVERTADYHLMFPGGYFNASQGKIGVLGEKMCSDTAKYKFNLRAGQLINGCCETRHNETTYR